ncbi:uncharacterized protein EMH_0076180 [Eimeria mitis]|uniref:Uncharacterized protein n=1 Tax=Eimeria mitis TaxID=44415 RepID=U6K4H3_9EIME|nr:uncharacterized protein EMH_0076180 [Eimeria mitis]CDJ32589.1 hypothetical protein EMH_0076180 [Eimeria mitis]
MGHMGLLCLRWRHQAFHTLSSLERILAESDAPGDGHDVEKRFVEEAALDEVSAGSLKKCLALVVYRSIRGSMSRRVMGGSLPEVRPLLVLCPDMGLAGLRWRHQAFHTPPSLERSLAEPTASWDADDLGKRMDEKAALQDVSAQFLRELRFVFLVLFASERHLKRR